MSKTDIIKLKKAVKKVQDAKRFEHTLGVAYTAAALAMRYEEEREIFNKMMKTVKKGYFRLPNDEFLENEMRDHYKEWRFLSLAEKIPSDLPLCFIGGSLDTTVPPRRHIFPLYDLLVKRGMHVSYHELIAGHIFAPLRITLTDLIFDSIADMEKTI